MGSLKVVFPHAPFSAFSGTLSASNKTIPAALKLQTDKIIEENLDKPNIYLAKFRNFPCGLRIYIRYMKTYLRKNKTTP